ncbi:MAG: hypothetical protein D3924_13185, partial [Candidatus Electrothrix sp. AR4]|nr:hypothetical protein [Candidatus Electrothrix sp. AR4]
LESRFTASDVVALLENQAILKRFDFTAEDITIMRSRIMDAGIRWGLDQDQRSEQGINSEQYTWDFGLNRLLLGYITGPLSVPWQGIMPCSGILNDTGPWLGGLADFIRHLQYLRREMSRNHSPADWAVLLLRLINDFLDCEEIDGADAMRDGLRILRQTIADFVANCRKAEFDQDISLAIIRHHFERQLAEPAGGQAFLSGRVTFCNMVPMRSVPFKVIWLLGMNDMDYPRSQRAPAFDLMAKHPRLGDRSRRDDDRYLFLEALLSARKHLSISWVGRNQQDNSLLPPSVVVAELRDYINRGFLAGDDASNKQLASEMLTVEYPLQPFSKHCFDGNPATATYASEWLPKPISQTDLSPVFFSQPLSEVNFPQQQVDIRQLVRFWNHPVRFFLEQRLGLRIWLENDLLPESEAFSLDHLQQYLLAQEIMTKQHNDRNASEKQPATLFYRMQAAGNLPGGRFGHILYQEMEKDTVALVERLESLTQRPAESTEINLNIDNTKVTGWLSSLYGGGRITLRPATLKAKDIMQLWIQHLVLLLVRPAAVQQVSVHAALDKTISFKRVDDPEAELAALLVFFRQGLSEPLHFYPTTSHAWAKAKSETAAWNAARRAWYSGYYKGEGEDPAYEVALRAHEPLDQQFENLAGVFRPVLQSIKNTVG